MSKVLNATISGTYKTAKGDVIDYDNVKIVLPLVERDLAEMHIQGRYAAPAIKADGRFKDRIDIITRVYVDEMEEGEADLSMFGKNILDMSFEELQDLATLKDLRRVPLAKDISGVSIREMRARAYEEYCRVVLNRIVDADVNYTSLEPVFVDDEGSRREFGSRKSGEASIETAFAGETEKSAFTLAELKEMAKQRGIDIRGNVGYDKLHAMLFA